MNTFFNTKTILQQRFNTRTPPRGAFLIDTVTYSEIDFRHGNIKYFNPWEKTIAKLTEWADEQGVSDELLDSLYPWALSNLYDNNLSCHLYIRFKNPDIQTLFNLYWL